MKRGRIQRDSSFDNKSSYVLTWRWWLKYAELFSGNNSLLEQEEFPKISNAEDRVQCTTRLRPFETVSQK